MNHKEKKLPVILLTGYLGSGKTTVMNEVLHNQQAKKIAVVVNDMGAVNVDAALLKNDSMKTERDFVELQNGCICCTLRDEFMTQIEKLAEEKEIDAILVEASGISNPSSIADAFLMYEEMHTDTRVELSVIATVVDADRIYVEFMEKLKDKMEEELEEDDTNPDIINLVMDQIEFCNYVILNKCDLLSEQQLGEVKQVLRQLQPDARIEETKFGKIDTNILFQGDTFDYDKVQQSSLMGRTLAGAHEEGEHDEYGISSFVFEDKRPFDYDKFMAFMENEYPETIIRAKGYLWFSDDSIHVQLFEQAGRNSTISELSNWTASFSKKEQEEVFEQYPEVLEDWDPVYGDRLNQIVFIGKGYDRKWMEKCLRGCLLSEFC